MGKIFNEFEAKKQELACSINVIPIINYFERLYGYQMTCDYVEPLGLPLSYLKNKRNWVSYDYYCALLEKLVEVTEDEKAPFNAVFSSKPDTIFQEFFYATYSSLYFTTPNTGYKLVLSKNFSQRYTKVGYFEIISSTKNSLLVKLNLVKGYKQNKYNCLAIQGFMSASTLPWGVPPAKVEHLECAAEGGNNCIYKIEWEERLKNWQTFIIPLLLIPILGIEFLFYNKFFTFKDIIITILLNLLFYFIFRIFHYKNAIQSDKIFNYEKNNAVLSSMEKIENDYNEILDTKMKLEERNKFLTIINEINKAIVTSFGFDNLLLIVGRLFFDYLKINQGVYFQFDFKTKIFRSIFEIRRENNEFKVYYNKHDISFNDYNKLKKLKYTFNRKELDTYTHPDNDLLSICVHNNDNNVFHILPIEIPDTLYTGFFILNSNLSTNITSDFYNMLFDNVIDLLKVAYQKISSRYIIENILSSIPANVLIFDIDKFEVKYVNALFLSAFQNLLNISSDRIVGSSVFDILPFDDETKKKVAVYVERLLNGEQLESYEINIGTNIYEYSLFNISQLGHDERLVGIILNDITEAKSFQQKLLINQKLIALGKVASGIAHEINNPLYAILANAEEIVEDKNASETTRQYAEEMIEHVMNVSNIIKDLSSYSKSLRKENLDEINLNDIIEESLKLVRYSSNFLEVEIIKKLGNLPLIKATKGEMEQVFINLFNNAIYAMNGKGYLTIESIYENNEIKIKISDTGTGIKEEVLPHIFELYFTTKQPGEGTGQGLHIVKKILANNKATINVESEVNKGTSFYIVFKLDNNNVEVKK
jgi:signal transduction histidine kinase